MRPSSAGPVCSAEKERLHGPASRPLSHRADNALNLMSLSRFAITIAKGGVILFAAVLDSTRRRYSGQHA